MMMVWAHRFRSTLVLLGGSPSGTSLAGRALKFPSITLYNKFSNKQKIIEQFCDGSFLWPIYLQSQKNKSFKIFCFSFWKIKLTIAKMLKQRDVQCDNNLINVKRQQPEDFPRNYVLSSLLSRWPFLLFLPPARLFLRKFSLHRRRSNH